MGRVHSIYSLGLALSLSHCGSPTPGAGTSDQGDSSGPQGGDSASNAGDSTTTQADTEATPTASSTDPQADTNGDEANTSGPGSESSTTNNTETPDAGDEDDNGDGDEDGERYDMFTIPDIDILPPSCPALHVTTRDFSQVHADFEAFAGDRATTGLVESQLGDDLRPVHASLGPTSQTSGPGNFQQWFDDVEGVNHRFDWTLELIEQGESCVYDNLNFFPVDGRGFGDEGAVDDLGTPHNFGFTSVIYTEFIHQRGQRFAFTGDDDLWVFIDGELVIDLGGVHPPLHAEVLLDELGLSEGGYYTLALFHAERAGPWSNFTLETNIDFVPPPSPSRPNRSASRGTGSQK